MVINPMYGGQISGRGIVGNCVGPVGCGDGANVGISEGAEVGSSGKGVGSCGVGWAEGSTEGKGVGAGEAGFTVGANVGPAV